MASADAEQTQRQPAAEVQYVSDDHHSGKIADASGVSDGSYYMNISGMQNHQSEHEVASMLLNMQQEAQTQQITGGEEEIPTAGSSSVSHKRVLQHDQGGPPMKKVAIDQMGLIGSPQGHDMTSAVGAPLHLVGGSCIYCGFEIKKPWDLVTHMVEQHEVQISNLNCGESFPIDPELNCAFCGVIFTVAHDLFYHLLIGHAKKIFGKEAMSDFCAIEMLTTDQKKLTLRVKIKRKDGDSAAAVLARKPRPPPRMPPMIRQRVGPQVGSPMAGTATFGTPPGIQSIVRYRQIPQSGPVPQVTPYREPPPGEYVITQDVINEAESHVRLHDKGFQCEFCYKIRETREDAILHVYRVHMNLRKFACPHCPKNYDNLKNLQTHVNAVHSPKRLYACPNCPMRYKYPGDLKRHLKKNVCERYKVGGYPCPKCGIMWYHQSALASHSRQCDGVA